VHARRPRVNDTLGNTLVIEMRDFFAKDEILQKGGTPRIGPERVLIIGKRDTLIRGERGVLSPSDLVELAAGRPLRVFDGSPAFFLFAFSRIIRCPVFVHDRSALMCVKGE
jgi:hypothetical protein